MRFGGTVVVVGMMEPDIVIENANALDSLILKEVSLKGCCGGTSDELAAIFDIIANKGYSPQLEEIPFDEIEDGVKRLAEGKVEGKLVALQD